MKSLIKPFNEHEVLHELAHFLPAQAPLKDFVHHNTLHAFQHDNFFKGIQKASKIFGYQVCLPLTDYRKMFESGRIGKKTTKRIIAEAKGEDQLDVWMHRLTEKKYDEEVHARIGQIRGQWKQQYKIDLDNLVHPLLFRILCSYLDQGISIWNFPMTGDLGFLEAIKAVEKQSLSSFFKSKRIRKLLLNEAISITSLLKMLIGGNDKLYGQYLFDQQFAHQGWSGMVAAIERQPEGLLYTRNVTLKDLITFELLLELDALDARLGTNWTPIGVFVTNPEDLFAEVETTELNEVQSLWQKAFEWSYYDQVLFGVKQESPKGRKAGSKTFQALLCIDDRECSMRRYLEQFDHNCETFGTPGFFAVEFYYKPVEGKFLTKLCPAPVFPKYLIKEIAEKRKQETEVLFSKDSHNFLSGWLMSQTLGFWSAAKLAVNLFSPSMSAEASSSLKHIDKFSGLTVLNENDEMEDGLQVGFKIEEMANRAEALLRSIGLVNNFAPLVYITGHGASSINNPHYSAYDCGACSGRAGSINSRLMADMINREAVREVLRQRGIDIPETTHFVSALHDTTRDDIVFYDEDKLSAEHQKLHAQCVEIFSKAADYNSKERSRRFESIDSKLTPQSIHEKVRQRSVSLFEPRPELNHATNALCLVGRRYLSENLFLDRRSFLNSYDYSIDPEGKYLLGILNAVAPVCGGINLEYYFSRVDNQKLGAGSKLPHNVMGLFGVANGIDGDLRPGLPSQMIEVHDPLRLLVVVEQLPDVVLSVIQRNPATYEWFINNWINLVVTDPETKKLWRFHDGKFVLYENLTERLPSVSKVDTLIESTQDNIPVHLLV